MGILGGTFDPVHNGHLALAEAAGRLCDISEIILIPAAVPPHKQNRKITHFFHRAAMLDIAVKEKPLLHVSIIEQLLPSPSFTIDTLQYLQLHSAIDLDLYFIIGADAFLDILSWKHFDRVLALCHFVVFSRAGSRKKKLHQLFSQLGYSATDECWYHETLKKTLFNPSVALPAISSSDVRAKIGQNVSVAKLVPDDVCKYIAEHHLYSE